MGCAWKQIELKNINEPSPYNWQFILWHHLQESKKKKQTKNKKIRDTQMKYDLETFFLQLTIYLMISLTGKQTDTNKILYWTFPHVTGGH